MALYHIDESGLLGKDSRNRPIVNYRTPGYPGDGIFPAVHYIVGLIQADGRFQLEQSKNRGNVRVLEGHLDVLMCVEANCRFLSIL